MNKPVSIDQPALIKSDCNDFWIRKAREMREVQKRSMVAEVISTPGAAKPSEGKSNMWNEFKEALLSNRLRFPGESFALNIIKGRNKGGEKDDSNS